MKRGLVVLDHTELPEAEWRRRLDAARSRLAEDAVDVALVYGDVFRSDDIAYLTNLCIYWNEGMLALPADGDPALLTKLSPRVHGWMRRTSTLADLRSGKDFGSLVTALLADREPGTLGLVDAPLWPAALVEEVTAAAPGWTVRPLGGLVRALRVDPSPAETALLRRAGVVLGRAVDAALAEPGPAAARIGVAEGIIRSEGFTDVVVRASEDPSGNSVEITGQHRNNWLRAARATGGPLTEALRAALGAAGAGVATSTLAAAAGARLGGLDAAWELRVLDHADLSTNGEYAEGVAELVAGQVVVIAVEAITPSGAALTASETVLVTRDGAEPLTGLEVSR